MAEMIQNALIGANGRPQFNIYNAPLTSLNLEDFRPYGMKSGSSIAKNCILKYRIKHWEYLGICNTDIVFGIAIVRLGYMCNLFAYLFERRSARLHEFNVLTPGGNAAIFDGNSLTGSVTFKSGNTVVRMTSDSETITVGGSIQGALSVNLSFDRHEDPLVCLTRVGLKGFNYTHKQAGIPVSGTIRHKGVLWHIPKDQSVGVLDYTLGYLARHTFWNWAAGGGLDMAGNRIGFNLVQGINETGFTENAFWVNGRLVKTDSVDIRYDDQDLLKPWRIQSNDGRVNLRFFPEGKRSANINAGLVVSKFHQPFGRFEGVLRDGDPVWQLQNAAGFTEEHYAKW